jgi:hypothetical protein
MVSQHDMVNPIWPCKIWIADAQHIFVVIDLGLLNARYGNVGGGN